MSEKNVALAGDAARHMFFAAEGCVSRKADFVPPLVEAFDDGWCVDDAPDDNQEIVDTVIVMPAVLPPTASSAPLLYSLYFVLPAYLGVCVCRAARKGGPRLADARAGALSGDLSRGRWSVSYGAGARQKTKKRRSATESGAPAMVEIAKRRNWGQRARARHVRRSEVGSAKFVLGNGKRCPSKVAVRPPSPTCCRAETRKRAPAP